MKQSTYLEVDLLVHQVRCVAQRSGLMQMGQNFHSSSQSSESQSPLQDGTDGPKLEWEMMQVGIFHVTAISTYPLEAGWFRR